MQKKRLIMRKSIVIKRRYLAFDKEEEIRANLNYLKTNLTRKMSNCLFIMKNFIMKKKRIS
ncbi:MAG: hypothetical protein L6U99_12770 [Clostridium sp.]|nr:MAG: hypothetical protein L6U99_12770 [Clostridium sp.]